MCLYCCIQGQYSKELQKMVYLDHRSFLPSIDRLGTDHKGLPTKEVAEKPLQAKTMEYVEQAISDIAKAPSAKGRKEAIQIILCGCTGNIILSEDFPITVDI